MKLSLKLSQDRYRGLYDLISYLLEAHPAENRAEKLLTRIVERMRIKMRNQLERCIQSRYTLVMDEVEATAFELWYNQVADQQGFIYERTNAQAVCNLSNQLFG